MVNPSHHLWLVEPLDRQKHDRAGFDCGVQLLNEWLKTRSGQFEKKDLARTYVLLTGDGVAVQGYYAISSHIVRYETLPDDQAKGLPHIDIPFLLIGRLAVDVSSQGQGIGEFLLIDALRRAEYLAARIGIRAVEVDAIDENAKRFYERYGLIALKDDPQHLLLSMNVVRKLKLPPL